MRTRYYEIDETNTIRLFESVINEDKSQTVKCILLQDIHPDGREWESREEAQAWFDSIPEFLIIESTLEEPAE